MFFFFEQAKGQLRKKKVLERMLQQKEASLENIHRIKMAIEQADSNKMVSENYTLCLENRFSIIFSNFSVRPGLRLVEQNLILII